MDTPSRSAVLGKKKKKKKKKERKFIIYEQKIDHTSQTEQLTHLSNWSFLGFWAPMLLTVLVCLPSDRWTFWSKPFTCSCFNLDVIVCVLGKSW